MALKTSDIVGKNVVEAKNDGTVVSDKKAFAAISLWTKTNTREPSQEERLRNGQR